MNAPLSKQVSGGALRWLANVPTGSLLVWTVVAAGIAGLADAAHQMLAQGIDTRWPLLAGLTVVGAAAMLKFRAAPVSFSISDTFTLTTLFLLGPAQATVTAALEAVTISALLSPSQRRPLRILFNVAAVAAAMRLAGAVFHQLAGRDLPALTARAPAAAALAMISAVACYFLLNTGIVSAAVALEQKTRWPDVWKAHFAHLWFNYFAGAYIALLLTLFAPSLDPLVLLLLMPMPLIMYGAFRMWVGRINERIDHLDRANRQYRATIEALAHAIDAKDQVTHGHIRRVQSACLSLAQALGCTDPAELQAIEAASLLHDLGKLAIPEHILNKPGRLTEAEFTRMKEHAGIGADILSGIEFPYPVVPIVRHHHESWNGTGYPDGLSGTRIPFGARILAVVDCYDALTSDRPYRPRMSRTEAVGILRERRGTTYDPEIVDAFIAHLGQPFDDQPSDSRMPTAVVEQEPRPLTDVHVSASDEVSPFAAAILVQVTRHFAASLAVLYKYAPECDGLQVAVWCGPAPVPRKEMDMALGERLSGWVGAARCAQINADPRLDAPTQEGSVFRGLHSALCVPIARGTELAGVLSIYVPESNRFTPGDLATAELVARLLAHPAVMPEPAAAASR